MSDESHARASATCYCFDILPNVINVEEKVESKVEQSIKWLIRSLRNCSIWKLNFGLVISSGFQVNNNW